MLWLKYNLSVLPARSSVRKKDSKETNSRPHDSVPFDKKKLCEMVCPECRLPSLCWLEDPAEIKRKNASILANNKLAREAWELAGSNGRKPAGRQTVQQTLVCYGYKLNCGCHPRGVGCYLCELQEGQVPKIDDPHGNGKRCGCEVCVSNCCAFLGRSKYNTFYLDAREREQNEKNGK